MNQCLSASIRGRRKASGRPQRARKAGRRAIEVPLKSLKVSVEQVGHKWIEPGKGKTIDHEELKGRAPLVNIPIVQ